METHRRRRNLDRMERVTIPDYLLIAERGEGNLSLIFLEAKYVSCPQAPTDDFD